MRSEEPRLNYLFLYPAQFDLDFFSVYKPHASVFASFPFLPSDDRLGTLRASCSNLDVFRVSLSPNGKGKEKEKEKRGDSARRRCKVDHWVPAIWIPDGKNEFLYEMWSEFGVASTRHHCRLCGRCICASCSGRVSSINFIFPR